MKAKGYTPGKFRENIVTALGAHRVDRTALDHLQGWIWLFSFWNGRDWNREALQRWKQTRESVLSGYKEQCEEMAGHIKWAIDKRDGSFFRNLAKVIELEDQLGSRTRLFIQALCLDFVTGKQIKIFTLAKMCALLKERMGISKSTREISTICKEQGIQFEPGKSGNPKRTRTHKK